MEDELIVVLELYVWLGHGPLPALSPSRSRNSFKAANENFYRFSLDCY